MLNKLKKPTAVVLATSLFAMSCASTTIIRSMPDGANVYLNEEYAGKTPYAHSDTRVTGSCMVVTLEKEGYEPLITDICRNEETDVGAIIGGFFFLFPFLWTMKYKPTHNYELIPVDSTLIEQNRFIYTGTESKYEQLRQLKELYDDGVLSKEEYEKEKKKILEEQ